LLRNFAVGFAPSIHMYSALTAIAIATLCIQGGI